MGGRSGKLAAQNSHAANENKVMASNDGGAEAVRPASGSLAQRWRELQGSNNWEGLLDPLDLELRKEIIRYGEFAGVPNCAFNDDPHSRRLGNSYFSKFELLQRCGLPNTGYTVTRFIYSFAKNSDLPSFIVKRLAQDPGGATQESNWIGFVMVATDPREIARLGRRDIVVVWRGTRRNLEWLNVVEVELVPISDSTPDIKAEKGFWNLFVDSKAGSVFNEKSAGQQVNDEVQRLVDLYKSEELSITCVGHSLGASLATFSAFNIAQAKINSPSHRAQPVPVTVINWGAPREGNKEFRDQFDSLGLRCLRIVDVKDILTEFPPSALEYSHLGVKLEVDFSNSPYLKPTTNPGDWHNLDGYLHLIDGTHGSQGKFSLEVYRDLALLNRSADLLIESYLVPGIWWQVENKGMVLSADGNWSEPQMDLALYI